MSWFSAAHEVAPTPTLPTEIATHTFSHAALTPGSVNITDQIQSQITFLNQTCAIPLEAMVGFRAPYLVSSTQLVGRRCT